MPTGRTTSNALIRSVVTMRSSSPRSYISRTLPLETCVKPSSSGFRRTLSMVAVGIVSPSREGDTISRPTSTVMTKRERRGVRGVGRRRGGEAEKKLDQALDRRLSGGARAGDRPLGFGRGVLVHAGADPRGARQREGASRGQRQRRRGVASHVRRLDRDLRGPVAGEEA